MSKCKLYELTSDELCKGNRVIVAGDIHGDYRSFRRICDLFDPKRDYLIFLGDYADRGAKGVEVIDGVGELIGKHPGNVIALKGNHEDYTEDGRPKFTPCDLIREADEKRSGWKTFFENELTIFLDKLYLSALISEVLFVHGGVSSKVKGIGDLRYPSKSVEEDILWSDPFGGDGEYPNIRGAGVVFGRNISEEVCRKLGVKRILRSHQPRKAVVEPYIEHEGMVITISSTIVYGGKPSILVLPAKNLDYAFKYVWRYTVNLR